MKRRSKIFLYFSFLLIIVFVLTVAFYQNGLSVFSQVSLMQPTVVAGKYSYSKMSKTFQGLFDKDPIAEKILAGDMKIDMFDYSTGICYPDNNKNFGKPVLPATKVPLEPYGAKILSGLRALGYNTSGSCDSWTKAHTFMRAVLHFQKDHDLPYSNFVDSKMLSTLKKDLAAIEKRDRALAKKFPCYEYLVPAPDGQIPKEHVAYLYASAMNAFPKKFQIKNKEECLNPQHYHQVAKNKKLICAEHYYGWYDEQCSLLTTPKFYNIGSMDFTTVAVWLHEYTHTIDRVKIDTKEFYNISYDVEDRVSGFYRMRPVVPEFADDGEDHSKSPEWNEIKQHFFSYADGWQSDENPGYYTAAEDFAVTVEMYVLHGAVFRDYMQDKAPLKKKYQWIKENVFEGKEFNTGDLNYKQYSPDLYFPPGGIVNASGYVTQQPVFKFDYKALKAVSKVSAPPNSSLDEAYATEIEITEALGEIMEQRKSS